MIPKELIQTENWAPEMAKKDHNLSVEERILQNRKAGDDWVISVRDKLEQAREDNKRTGKNYTCIYKVPPYLYEKNKKSYFPQTVSIGPYHHGEDHLQAMECHKWRAVAMVLERTNQKIETYLNAMSGTERIIHARYEGSIDLDDRKLREMLVVDGCFVLELLVGAAFGFSNIGYPPNDPVFAIGGLMHSIRLDMLMLENQISFNVLFDLAELQNRGVVVRKLANHFFDPLMPTSRLFTNTTDLAQFSIDSLIPEEERDLPHELHCLNLFRYTLLEGISETSGYICERGKMTDHKSHRLLNGIATPELICERDTFSVVADKRQQRLIRCVTELRDAGFKFRERDSNSFWDIQFNEGYLEIPKLLINDGTKCLFLNLIAYEQRHIFLSNYITSYIIFMDNLIDTAEDVHYLRQCGIIEHSLGSDAVVADMFNGLCHEVVFNTGDVYLSQRLKEVEGCYKRRYYRKLNALKRILKNKYFDSPWAYFSFFAALILLFLTCAQTYFAAYDYFKSGS